MVSEWMDHGTITEFVEKHRDVSRVQLVRFSYAKICGRGLPIHSAGRRCERVGVYAWRKHGAWGFESGTALPVTGPVGTYHDDQANILINRSFRACLADFGLSTIVRAEHRAVVNSDFMSISSEPSLMSFTAGGSARWMSPELHDPEQFGITDDRPTKQSDCYAFGMVLYEVCVDG